MISNGIETILALSCMTNILVIAYMLAARFSAKAEIMRLRTSRDEWRKSFHEKRKREIEQMGTINIQSREIKRLKKIVREYAPEWDNDAKRWRDPRTGEFIDNDDVIVEVLPTKGELTV